MLLFDVSIDMRLIWTRALLTVRIRTGVSEYGRLLAASATDHRSHPQPIVTDASGECSFKVGSLLAAMTLNSFPLRARLG